MASGPMLIFDKSTLQSLNPDEAVWLDNFFMTNITPLFFVETLADLEKEVRAGRTPEEVVGNLAYKTPDLQSRPNAHHLTLLGGELVGVDRLDLVNGRPHIVGGTKVHLEGRAGVIFRQAPEEEAFHRWQKGDFLDVERLIAKRWRSALITADFRGDCGPFAAAFAAHGKPKDLPAVKALAESVIDDPDTENVLIGALGIAGVPRPVGERALERWRQAGRPPIRDFAPYLRHIAVIEFFFYLAVAADLISRERPSNKVDLAYLYYLPFCMIFVSSDKLHRRVVPLFLRPNQSFIEGKELKADLARLDAYYSSLPEEAKAQGLFELAPHPPADDSYLVTRLWDRHLPGWRQSRRPSQSEEVGEAILEQVRRLREEATPAAESGARGSDDVDHMLIERRVFARKGKWRRFPKEV